MTVLGEPLFCQWHRFLFLASTGIACRGRQSHQNEMGTGFRSSPKRQTKCGPGYAVPMGLLYVPSMAVLSHYFDKRHEQVRIMWYIHPIMLDNTINDQLGFANGVPASAGLISGVFLTGLVGGFLGVKARTSLCTASRKKVPRGIPGPYLASAAHLRVRSPPPGNSPAKGTAWGAWVHQHTPPVECYFDLTL